MVLSLVHRWQNTFKNNKGDTFSPGLLLSIKLVTYRPEEISQLILTESLKVPDLFPKTRKFTTIKNVTKVWKYEVSS